MHRHILAFAAALTFLSKGDLYAQVPPCTGPLPDHVYGSFGMDFVISAVPAVDGNVFVIGSVSSEGGNVGAVRHGGRDAIVLKLGPDGDLIWATVLGGPDDDELRKVLPSMDGGCFASGSYGDADGWRLRLDAAGAKLWEWFPTTGQILEFYGPGILLSNNVLIDPVGGGSYSMGDLPPHPDVITGLRKRSPDGGFISARTLFSLDVTGIWSSTPSYLGSGEDIGLVKTDASGILLWAKRIQSPSIDGLQEMIVLPDGYLLLSRSFGSMNGGDRLSTIYGLHDFWVIRTDLDGNILWERSYGSFNDDVCTGMIQDTDGSFILYGRTEMAPTFDVTEPLRSTGVSGIDGWMVKIDGAGNKIWNKRWGGGGTDRLYGCVPVTGGYLVLGGTESGPGYDRTAPAWGQDDIWAIQMRPGTASTWYADADADGYGDPEVSIVTCAPPPGHVANGLDCDPLVPNPTGTYVGARCSDGNLFTFPDRVGEDCTCQGSIPDFLFDNLVFNLLPDAFAGGMSMSIFRQGEPNAVLSFGPWPNAQPGVTITEQFQLPPGAYTMRVFDAQGDGIMGGGFTLIVNGKRVIQADGAFQQLSEAPLGFELPMGERSLTNATCDRLDLLPTSSIIASPEPLVSERYSRADATTGYQFWIFNPHGGYSRRIYQSHRNPGQGSPPGPDACAHLKLSNIVTSPVPQMVLLNVRVRPRVDGVYGPFGPACTIKVDPYAQVCPTTKLVDQPGNPNFSCGAQRSFGGSSKVVANAVSGANKYQFEFVEPINGYTRRITSANNTRLLNWTTQQPLCGTFTYQVRVRVSFDGGQNWCPWGAPCPVTIVNYQAGCTPVVGEVTEQGQRGMEASLREPGFRVYPTVTEQRVLWLQAPGTGDLQVEVVSLTGELVHTGRLAMPYASIPVELALPAEIVAGIYLVRMVQGDVLHTERVVLR